MTIDRKDRSAQLLQRCKEVGVLLTNDHFLLTSGKHSGSYFAKDIIYSYPGLLKGMIQGISDDLDLLQFDVVVGPEKGGIILSGATAMRLSASFEHLIIRNAFAEKNAEGKFYFGRGYDQLIPGKKIVITEDVLTTGGSVASVIAEVTRLGGEVVAVCAICNRGGVTAEDLGVPNLFSLMELDIPTYTEADCPSCQAGLPFNQKFGHGKNAVRKVSVK